jgi:uncharacterized membrane protein
MNWIMLGIGASILWGIFAVTLRISISEDYYGTSPKIAFIGLMTGMFLVTVLLLTTTKTQYAEFSRTGFFIAISAGIIWSLGMVLIIYALTDVSTPISRLVPLYNTNTLVAVLIGIILLKEVPEERIRTIIGALLIVLGGILLSR